jgi:NADPH-dependent FMN reductase
MASPRNVVVLVGSLRKDSINRKVAHALIELAPSSLKLEIVEIGCFRSITRTTIQIRPSSGPPFDSASSLPTPCSS